MSSDHASPSNADSKFDPLARYARQTRFARLGEAGQRRLLASRALVCGCGALGTVIANTLVRAGVGHVRIVDRDFVEFTNLQRQVLFDEQDVAATMPKAVAAAEKLRRVNSAVEIEPIVADVEPSNVEELCRDVDCIVDGTDNFETRFLLNDVSVKHGIPWVYGGCLASEGQTMSILPGETPCLRCLMQEPPPAGMTPTCDTAGILAPIIGLIASIQAMEAIKILSGNRQATQRSLVVIDLWDMRLRQLGLEELRAASDCGTCQRREFAWLDGQRGSQSVVMCGRNAVQIAPANHERVDLERLAEKLAGVGKVTRNPFLLRMAVENYQLTIFPDGRVIVGGTDEIAVARSVCARYVGS